ncbi:MAG: hypothetical protein IPK82_39885 [Polyangiaceae bacterium]|nr:hypothetical protein [Polyangiaceae bacterium]
MSTLGKLVDKAALEADAGGRVRARVTVPLSWSQQRVLIEVTLPRAMECARCDGGGCDGCDRSGALRGPKKDLERVVRVRLPKMLGDGVAMRLSEPFGKGAVITQLWLEVRPGDAASPSVRRIGGGERKRILPTMVWAMTVLVIVVGAALAALTWATGGFRR